MDGRRRIKRRAFLKGAMVIGGGALAAQTLAACAPPGSASGASGGADNKALARQIVDEVWNQGNVAAADKLYHPHYAHYDPNFQQADDLAGLKEHVKYMRTSFANLKMTIDDIIGEADKVGIRWTVQGTHQGEFMGVPATGQPVTVTGTSILRIAGGKIGQGWQVWNLSSILPQIGAMPATGAEVYDWGEPLGNVAGATGTLEQNKGVVQGAISRFFNDFNWEAFDDVYHPDYRNHAPSGPTQDLEANRTSIEAIEAAFPDLHTVIHDLVAEKDKVVKRWQSTYTHLGTYMGVPATGNAGLLQGINVYRIADGKVAEIWWGQDQMSMLRTMGLMP